MNWAQALPLILITLVAFGIAISSSMANAEAKGLPKKFAQLGNIKGMPIEDIVAAVGPANSISCRDDGMLYQWQKISPTGAAHYAVLVDADGKAVGYTHQHVS